MDSKQLVRVEIKDAAKGEVEAVFATLNTKDKDNDVTPPGAFTDGAPVRISAFGHKSWEGALPVGKGTIREIGNEAVFKGQFFMNTTSGRDTFEVVKQMLEDGGPGMEWSYGYTVKDSEQGEFKGESVRFLKELEVHEVSPVMQGAGVGTRTVGVKQADMEMLIEGGMSPEDAKAWVEGKRTFSAEQRRSLADSGKAMPDGSFPIVNEEDLHNAVRAIGRAKNPGAAKRHIMKRARAMGMMDAIPDDWKSFNADIELVTDFVADIRKGAERVVALRAEKGKKMSQVNADSLDGLRSELAQLEALVAELEDHSAELRKIDLQLIASELE